MESSDTCSLLFVSWYSQINARIDTSGMEAKMLPIKELLLEISETAAIIPAEINIFTA